MQQSAAEEVDNWIEVLAPLVRDAGFTADITGIRPLSGGVSSDIVEVALADGRRLCAKRALSRLKVADVWEAPLERNHYEVAWLRRAAEVVPSAVPRVWAEDRVHGIALLEYLPEDAYLLWKRELLDGRYRRDTVERVAAALAAIHTASWGNSRDAETFATDELIDALRLDPYLRTTAERTPDLRERILGVLAVTANTKLALVHGDVSPKNILVARSDGHPVFLDAECAWFGDPVFDAAFCINHLLLKAVHVAPLRDDLLTGAAVFGDVWLAGIPAPDRADADKRLAALLPCLQLARVDGKSPVEYLSSEGKQVVRDLARPLIAEPAGTVHELIDRQREQLRIGS